MVAILSNLEKLRDRHLKRSQQHISIEPVKPEQPRHRMKIVAQRTGLSPHVVRAWEKRYGAVEPNRSGTNRRLYSDADIERLSLLHELTQAGHSIGQIANLDSGQLRALAAQTQSRESSLIRLLNAGAGDASDKGPEDGVGMLLDSALQACRRMDQQRLESILDRAVVELGYSGLVEKLAGPLITSIGDEWHQGRITAAQEHAATATIRAHIEKHVRLYPIPDTAPKIVITTPAGQLHELGAVLATAVARKIGWNVVYLGPSLPAAEIVGAVQQSRADVLALSISFPADDPDLAAELKTIRSLAGKNLSIFAGGRSATAYSNALEESDIEYVASLAGLRERLIEKREKGVQQKDTEANAGTAAG